MITLYDQPGEQGKNLPITDSVPDLSILGFTFDVASFGFGGGTWRLYDAINYQGTFIQVASADDLDCILDGSPIDVHSVKLMTKEIILYEHAQFAGTSLPLTESTPDLGSFGDRASSIIVLDGQWRLYKDPNYQGASAVFEPGSYNIAQVAAILGNDVISSVQFEVYTPVF